MGVSGGFFGCRSRCDNNHHGHASPPPTELEEEANVAYRPATGPAGERDEREPSLGGADQANEAAARREHEEQVYGRGYTHPFCARWQHGTDRRPTTPGGADADRDGGVLFADGSRVRRVAAGEETREETEEEAQARREHDEILAKARIHWEELKIVEAMLKTSPSLRVKSGTELAHSKMAFTNGDDCCSICLEDFDPELKYRELPCGHIFHIGCVDAWLEKRTTCPVCKGSVIEKSSTLDQMAAKETVRINTEKQKRRHELNKKGSTSAAGAPGGTQKNVSASGSSVMSQCSASSMAPRRYLAYV